MLDSDDLVEWVGAGTPVGEEHAEADSFQQASQDADSNSINWAVLNDKGGNELRSLLAFCFGYLDRKRGTYRWAV